jgi:hypothetical protein
MSKIYTIIIGLVVVGVTLVVIPDGSYLFTRAKYKGGYAQIAKGHSKQHIVDLLGEPLEVENCRPDEKCKEVYVYYVLMEKWGYVLDADGNVIQTYESVSP